MQRNWFGYVVLVSVASSVSILQQALTLDKCYIFRKRKYVLVQKKVFQDSVGIILPFLPWYKVRNKLTDSGLVLIIEEKKFRAITKWEKVTDIMKKYWMEQQSLPALYYN